MSYLPYIALISTAIGVSIRAFMYATKPKPPPYTHEPITGPSLGDQTIGEPCVLCEGSIMVEAEGRRCRVCSAIIHARCAKAHARIHQKQPAPYR